MMQQQHDQKQVLIQAALDAFQKLPIQGKSWFPAIEEDSSDYSWGYEFDR
tara:strand:+ start:365 stop:514 length:150 start_codon:yes stop_codon:yes gene_type:complete